MSEERDIVERLKKCANENAVCHCGEPLVGGSCDNHDSTAMYREEEELMLEAADEITRLRAENESLQEQLNEAQDDAHRRIWEANRNAQRLSDQVADLRDEQRMAELRARMDADRKRR